MTTPTPSPDPSPGFQPDELVVGRVTLLHPSVLADIAGVELVARTERLVARVRSAAAEATTLGDRLYDVIGATPSDHRLRSSVVAVRRSVHGGTAPAAHLWSEDVREHLGRPLVGRIDGWSEEQRAVDEDLAALDALAETDLARRAVALREACRDEWFRHGLAVASPTLAAALRDWLAHPDRTPRRKTRLALLRYLTRAATKTSPFSSFNHVVGGGFADQPDPVALDLTTARSVLEIDPATWQHLTGAVGSLAAAGVEVPLEVDPSLRREAESYAHLGPVWDERWTTVPATAAVDVALDAVRHDGGRGHTAVVDRLVAAGAGREQASALLDQLLARHVVRPRPARPPRDVPGGAAEAVRALAPGDAEPLGGVVAALDRHLGRARPAPGPAGRDRRAVADGLDDLARVAGLDGAGAGPGRATVHDTLVAGPGSLRLSSGAWSGALADLDRLLAWLPLFDPLLGYRLAISELVRREHGDGAEVPLLALHRWLDGVASGGEDRHADLVPFLTPAHVTRPALLEASGVARMVELARMRDRWRTELLPVDGPPDTVVWSAEVLARQRREAPPWVTAPPSLTAYVQPETTHEEVRLVLNTVHGGDGRGRSRWTWLTGAPPPRALDGAGGGGAGGADGGAEAVGLDGLWGSALGLHDPTTPRSIEYPGEPATHGPAETIRLGDLSVHLDDRTGLLGLHEHGRPVRVAHGSMMSEAFAPPLARLLLGCFATSYLEHSSLPVVPSPRPRERGAAGRRGRVELGRVVVARAAWAFPPPLVPRRGEARTDARHLLRVAAWADEHEVPRHVFVRPGGDEGGAERLGKQHKPMYVDLRQLPLLEVLDRLVDSLDQGQWLVLEEALPVPGGHGAYGMLETLVERPMLRSD